MNSFEITRLSPCIFKLQHQQQQAVVFSCPSAARRSIWADATNQCAAVEWTHPEPAKTTKPVPGHLTFKAPWCFSARLAARSIATLIQLLMAGWENTHSTMAQRRAVAVLLGYFTLYVCYENWTTTSYLNIFDVWSQKRIYSQLEKIYLLKRRNGVC